ncbi:MAG: STAS domain-containing protein [Acidimicrobiaceae bacterium]|nr:STAS domain-containing protein [Acidimicrobiaceae bacterium]MCY4174887.1 STAS domain-containing protein [Acidimicrobiaceae bacterium]MCY4280366.1 STAS domain-containing protein [Acidimicrobiaceae bacterium]MCY4294456.1 STAS domain-containing protein [Acidimicrobiaceae bacterium]
MEINVERHEGVVVIGAEGRIDSSNSREFHSGIEAAIADDDQGVVVDFERVSYISSAGMRVILLLAKTLKNKGTELALCSMQESVLEIFTISGFDKIIALHDSRSDAVSAITA